MRKGRFVSFEVQKRILLNMSGDQDMEVINLVIGLVNWVMDALRLGEEWKFLFLKLKVIIIILLQILGIGN
jgi:hypothetical protein